MVVNMAQTHTCLHFTKQTNIFLPSRSTLVNLGLWAVCVLEHDSVLTWTSDLSKQIIIKPESLKLLFLWLRGPASGLLVYRYVQDREAKNILCVCFSKAGLRSSHTKFFPLSQTFLWPLRNGLGAQNPIKIRWNTSAPRPRMSWNCKSSHPFYASIYETILWAGICILSWSNL